MLRMSIPWIIGVVQAVDELKAIKNAETYGNAFIDLYAAKNQLESILNGSIYSPYVRISRQKGEELLEVLDRMTQNSVRMEDVIPDHQVWSLNYRREQFATVFLAEISALPAYLVSRKENYDIDLLIEAGSGLFPPNMLKKVPETYADAMEVGRCLAYELYTACGFHTFRVVEAVARRYWDHVTSGKTRPVPETVGNIAGQLEIGKFGETKTIEALKQMTKLHRNPLAHHDVMLTSDEAGSAIGMARSAITIMLQALPDALVTTDSAPISAGL